MFRENPIEISALYRGTFVIRVPFWLIPNEAEMVAKIAAADYQSREYMAERKGFESRCKC